jgi:hypothetical protein
MRTVSLTVRTRDFNSTKNAVHMAINSDVAEKYAFLEEPRSAVVILRMEILNSSIKMGGLELIGLLKSGSK